MNNSNVEVRVAMLRAGLEHWQVAHLLGIREKYFSHIIGKEQPDYIQTLLINAIENRNDPEKLKGYVDEIKTTVVKPVGAPRRVPDESVRQYAENIVRDVEMTEMIREDEKRYRYGLMGGDYEGGAYNGRYKERAD